MIGHVDFQLVGIWLKGFASLVAPESATDEACDDAVENLCFRVVCLAAGASRGTRRDMR